MGTRTNEKSNNGKIRTQGGEQSIEQGARRRARSIEIGDTINTSRDFANFMSALVGDIVSGRIDPRTANAACNAGGKLLKVVEMEHKYGRKKSEAADKALQLT